MSTNTNNYDLVKPAYTDRADIAVINSNMDIIDENLDRIECDGIGKYTATNDSNNEFTITDEKISTYEDMKGFCIKFPVDFTAAGSLRVNTLEYKALKDGYGEVITDLKANIPYTFRYDTTNSVFTLQGRSGGGTAIPEDLILGKTATVTGGKITGTMSDRTAITAAVNKRQNGTTAYLDIPFGAYRVASENGYPSVSVGTSTLDSNISAPNIKTGVEILGVTGTFTADATATAAQLMYGKIAYVKGSKITGTAPTKAATTYTPTTSNQTIASGTILTGIQTIKGDTNLVAANILSGKTVFGISGTGTLLSFVNLAAGGYAGFKVQYRNYASLFLQYGGTDGYGKRCVINLSGSTITKVNQTVYPKYRLYRYSTGIYELQLTPTVDDWTIHLYGATDYAGTKSSSSVSTTTFSDSFFTCSGTLISSGSM